MAKYSRDTAYQYGSRDDFVEVEWHESNISSKSGKVEFIDRHLTIWTCDFEPRSCDDDEYYHAPCSGVGTAGELYIGRMLFVIDNLDAESEDMMCDWEIGYVTEVCW